MIIRALLWPRSVMNASPIRSGARDAESGGGRRLTSPGRRTTLPGMKASRERILTSHAGSLPRPDDLIEANRAREADDADDERGFPGAAPRGGGRRRAPPDGSRHQRSRRRRVRQVDGPSRELPRLVELFVPAPGRPRARDDRSLRHAAAPRREPGRGRAHELRRPPRSAAASPPPTRIPSRASRPGRALHDWPVCVGAAHLHRPRRDRGRHRQLQGGARGRRRRARAS